MGRVTVAAKIENLDDLKAVRRGHLRPEDVRTVEVDDAFVDTGASMLSMPKRLIEQLGHEFLKTGQAKTTTGLASFPIYEPVRLTVEGRDCDIRVVEVHDNCPVLIGYLALAMLDLLVDAKRQRLIGNPSHDGNYMIDMY